MEGVAARVSGSERTGTVGRACSSWEASQRTSGTPRLGRTTATKADSGIACNGFSCSSVEVQRLPPASGGRPLCVVSNATCGAGGCRQTSGLHRRQTYLASPPAAPLGHGHAHMRNWIAGPHECDGSPKYPDDPPVFEGRPARLTTRVLPGTAKFTSVLHPSLALRLYVYSRSACHPPSARGNAPSIGNVSTAILR